jgi:micrococcal nuclease
MKKNSEKSGGHTAGLMTLCCVLALVAAFSSNGLAHEQAEIVRVIDGDTVAVSLNGRRETVRLIGIDTPESRPNRKAKKDAERSKNDVETITSLGKKATGYVEGLLKAGTTVEIEFDLRQRDRYGRLLGYLYLSDGRMVNEEIMRAGYASPMTMPPNVKYRDRFLEAFHDAREHRRGLWG